MITRPLAKPARCWRWRQRGISTSEPYQDNLSALIHEPTFKAAAGPVFHKARLIKDLGNDAAHRTRRITPQDGVGAVRELFHFATGSRSCTTLPPSLR